MMQRDIEVCDLIDRYSVRDIAKQYGVSRGVIIKILRRNHITFTKEQIRERVTKANRSITQINKMLETQKRLYKDKKSKTESLFLDRIEEIYHIDIERQFVLGGFSYDGRYNHILIEVDGSYWHNLDSMFARDIWKSILADNNGFILLRYQVDRKEEVEQIITNNRLVLDKVFGYGL